MLCLFFELAKLAIYFKIHYICNIIIWEWTSVYIYFFLQQIKPKNPKCIKSLQKERN